MKIKQFFFGEKMPDMDSPDKQEKREKRREDGRKFAKATRIDRVCGKLQCFGNSHSKLFYAIIVCLILFILSFNIGRMITSIHIYRSSNNTTKNEPLDTTSSNLCSGTVINDSTRPLTDSIQSKLFPLNNLQDGN